LQWNNDFIVALREAMNLLEDNTYRVGAWFANVVITDRNNTQNDKNWFKFNDMLTMQNVKAELLGKKEVRIALQFIDGNGRTLYRQCYVS
jgi:hypothetical protein